MPAFRHRVAHFLLKKAGFFNRKYRDEIAGREFVIPIVNGRKSYDSERWMNEILIHIFKVREGSFIDIGVNLGQTLLKVAAADENRKYVGFEPNPACADYASELIAANGLPYVVIPAALSSKTGLLELQIYRGETTDPSASLVQGFRDEPKITKPVISICPNDLPQNIFEPPIAAIKIDVEGGEADVLNAVAPFLTQDGPFILMEILPFRNFNSQQRLENQIEIQTIIREKGYRIYRVIRDPSDCLVGIHHVDEIGDNTDLAMCDFIMAPIERATELEGLILA